MVGDTKTCSDLVLHGMSKKDFLEDLEQGVRALYPSKTIHPSQRGYTIYSNAQEQQDNNITAGEGEDSEYEIDEYDFEDKEDIENEEDGSEEVNKDGENSYFEDDEEDESGFKSDEDEEEDDYYKEDGESESEEDESDDEEESYFEDEEDDITIREEEVEDSKVQGGGSGHTEGVDLSKSTSDWGSIWNSEDHYSRKN